MGLLVRQGGWSCSSCLQVGKTDVGRAIVAVILMLVVTGCGRDQAAAGGSPSPTQSAQASSTRLASPPRLSPTSTPGLAIPANCPATVTNTTGTYSFQCRSDWRFLNCEAYAYTWLINPYGLSDGCLDEAYGARMMVWSVSGDHPGNPENMSLGELRSSQTATVAGVTGTRRTYLEAADHPLPPPKGTFEVLYTFVTGGRTYFAFYARYPGDADLTTGFDQMITGTLKFSA